MSATTIVITILGVLGAVLFAIATRLSEALVRFRARRLPSPSALRMEEEWLGELNAIASRPGRLTFAIALTLTRRRAFIVAGEDSMTEIHDRPTGQFLVLGSRKSLLILTTLVFATAAYGVSFLLPVRYGSQALILVAERRVPTDLVRGLPEEPLKDQIPALLQLVQSRTNLVAIALELRLGAGRKDPSLDRLIEELRKDITVRFTPSTGGDSSTGYLVVNYIGDDPSLAQNVTRKLTLSFVEAANHAREAKLAGTREFLRRQLDQLAARVTEKGDELAHERAAHGPEAGRILAINYELLVSTYKTLFAKYEDAQIAVTLEQEQRGAIFTIVDPANPGQPVVPNRAAIAALGALAGMLLGGMGVVGLNRRQRRALA